MGQAFSARRRATYGSLVEIGLKKMNNGKDDYSVATFRLLSDFSGDELAQVRAYADSFKMQVRTMLNQNTAAEPRHGNSYADPAAVGMGTQPMETSGQPYYGQSIYGDYEALPA